VGGLHGRARRDARGRAHGQQDLDPASAGGPRDREDARKGAPADATVHRERQVRRPGAIVDRASSHGLADVANEPQSAGLRFERAERRRGLRIDRDHRGRHLQGGRAMGCEPHRGESFGGRRVELAEDHELVGQRLAQALAPGGDARVQRDVRREPGGDEDREGDRGGPRPERRALGAQAPESHDLRGPERPEEQGRDHGGRLALGGGRDDLDDPRRSGGHRAPQDRGAPLDPRDRDDGREHGG